MIRKLLTILLAFCLCACTSSTETKEKEVETTGSWEMVESNEATLSEEEQFVFEQAVAQWDGIGLKAVASLATQVVSGTNYAFLTESTVEGKITYHVTIVYKDLDGNVTLTSVKDIDVTSKEYGTHTEGETGGWTLVENTGTNPSSEDSDVLEKVQGESVGYQLLATLATQVVSGTNYCFLTRCADTSDVNNPLVSLKMVYVYQNLNGKTEITDSVDFEISYFNN